MDPIRPLTIQKKKSLPAISKSADKICKEYEDQNIAVIHAPREIDWMISVMKYLHEFDQSFPDRVQESFGLTQMGANNMFSFGGRGSPDYLN